jgi:ribose-phosphate pyrophosphokinase
MAEFYAEHEPHITKTPELYQPQTRKTIENAGKVTAAAYSRSQYEMAYARRAVAGVFSKIDLLVLPTMLRPPQRIEDVGKTRQASLTLVMPFDLYGLPALTLPCGFTKAGFPIGFQIVGPSFGELKVFSGSAHPELTRDITAVLGVPVGQARLKRFPDTEVSFQIDENIRGTDVFIVQPTCASPTASVDQHLVELMIMIDAFRRSSAARITAVIPYYGYARQDRKDKPRVPISAKLVANVLTAAGVNRVLCMDLHKAQIQGFFDLPVDHLFAAPVIIDYLSRQSHEKLTIVAPDAGGAERARAYAKRLDAELAVIDKRRTEDGTAEVMNVIGEVAGRTCVIADDIIDTAGTIQKAAQALKESGAERVLACAIHGVLSGPAIERIEKAPIDKLIITNTIPLTAERAKCQKIVVLSVARLLGQAIRSIHEETSVSSLFV